MTSCASSARNGWSSNSRHILALWTFVTLFFGSALGGAAENVGGLTSVPFHQLTDRAQSPLGKIAMTIHPQDWKHAETEHFVYHYINSYVVTPASVQAEFYYRVISRDLQKEDEPWQRKSHIYLFEKPDAWDQFKTHAKLDPWTGGINVGDELFLCRDPSYKWDDPTLGHEITHLLLNRYFPGNRLPLWLNEGYSEYISKISYVAFYRARGYNAKPRSKALQPHEFMPLPQLFSTAVYPKNTATVRTFYLQSEKLVWFLHSVDEDDTAFVELMNLTGTGTPFASAFSRTFGGQFPNMAQLETQFKAYATRHAESDPNAPQSIENAEPEKKLWLRDR